MTTLANGRQSHVSKCPDSVAMVSQATDGNCDQREPALTKKAKVFGDG